MILASAGLKSSMHPQFENTLPHSVKDWSNKSKPNNSAYRSSMQFQLIARFRIKNKFGRNVHIKEE